MSGGKEPGDPVQWRAEVVLAPRLRLATVQRHPHSQPPSLAPWLGG